MSPNIDDTFEFKQDVLAVLKKHLAGPCKKHFSKAIEWVRPNMRTFVESVERDLNYFAANVIPVGEKLDAEQKEIQKDAENNRT